MKVCNTCVCLAILAIVCGALETVDLKNKRLVDRQITPVCTTVGMKIQFPDCTGYWLCDAGLNPQGVDCVDTNLYSPSVQNCVFAADSDCQGEFVL